MPILREKVAEAMDIPLEDLLGKEKKAVILETFQEFLLSKSEGKTSENGRDDNEEFKSESEETIPVKTKKSKVKASEESEKTKKKTGSPKKKKKPEESSKSSANNKTVTSKSSSTSSPSKSAPSAKSLQIDKLKSYVFKCGVRKVW